MVVYVISVRNSSLVLASMYCPSCRHNRQLLTNACILTLWLIAFSAGLSVCQPAGLFLVAVAGTSIQACTKEDMYLRWMRSGTGRATDEQSLEIYTAIRCIACTDWQKPYRKIGEGVLSPLRRHLSCDKRRIALESVPPSQQRLEEATRPFRIHLI